MKEIQIERVKSLILSIKKLIKVYSCCLKAVKYIKMTKCLLKQLIGCWGFLWISLRLSFIIVFCRTLATYLCLRFCQEYFLISLLIGLNESIMLFILTKMSYFLFDIIMLFENWSYIFDLDLFDETGPDSIHNIQKCIAKCFSFCFVFFFITKKIFWLFSRYTTY